MKRFANRCRRVALGALMLAATAWQPASAAIITATWEGTTSLNDSGNFFGLGAGNLSAVDATLVFTFDDATPGATLASADNPPYTQLTGEGAASPGDAVLTINGISRFFDGDADPLANSSFSKQNNSVFGLGDSLVLGVITERFFNSGASVSYIGEDLFLRDSLTENFVMSSTDPATEPTLGVSFFFFDQDSNGITFFVQGQYSSGLFLGGRSEFAPSQLTVDSTLAAVPEPAAWGMMICGFGAVGGVLRARPRLRTATA